MRSTLSSGVAGCDLQQLGLFLIGQHGADFFLGTHHAHAKVEFKHGVGRPLVVGQLLGREAFEGLPGQPDVFQDGGYALQKTGRAAPA